MKKSLFFLCCILLTSIHLQAQEVKEKSQKIFDTFKDRRIINSHSIETLQKRQLDFRIAHRFGDIAGDAGGWATFYGFENAADVLIGLEYGLTDRLTLGMFRTKAAGPLKALIHTQAKYSLVQQRSEGMPFSLTTLAFTAVSTMKKSDKPEDMNHFAKKEHRLVYGLQIMLARKFSNRFSLQVTPGFLHRNIVPFSDNNNLFSIGIAGRIQLSKVIALLLDYSYAASDYRKNNNFTNPFGFGLEFDTGGHVFQINFTNAKGLAAADYLPYTDSAWGDGEFRIGFTISRLFNL